MNKSLYDRLGGIFAIAAIVDRFSDALIENPIVGENSLNPALRDWHRYSLHRLPGLKWMRTLWVANLTGGPYGPAPKLHEAHRQFKITSEEFDAVAEQLRKTLVWSGVKDPEPAEVMSAFVAHKKEVVPA